MLVFYLKAKSKDDKGSMREIASMMKASKRKQKRSKESKAKKAIMIIKVKKINHHPCYLDASINAEAFFFSLLQTLSTRVLLHSPCSSGVFASLALVFDVLLGGCGFPD